MGASADDNGPDAGESVHMMINRRTMLGGAGAVGVAAIAGAGADRAFSTPLPRKETQENTMTDNAARFGNPRIPAELNTAQPHMFHLGALAPTQFEGGTLRQAYEGNWPILTAGSQRGDGHPGARWHP